MSNVETVRLSELQHIPPDPVHFLEMLIHILEIFKFRKTASMTYLAVLLHKIFLTELGIDLGPVEDAPGPGSVVEGGEGLLHVDGSWGDRGDDGGLRPPAQRVLEQPGEF